MSRLHRVILSSVLAAWLSSLLLCTTFAATPEQEKEWYVGLQKATPEQIHQVLPGTEGKPVFLEFKSKFCLACKKMDPILERLLPQYPEIDKRIFDMIKDRSTQPQVFGLFKPAVVPIQVYINAQGEVVNVFYDFHPEAELKSALDCIKDPKQTGTCSSISKAMAQDKSWSRNIERTLNQNIQTGSILTLVLAFLAGVVSSFFPCTLAMLPILVASVGGFSDGSKKDIFLQVGMFILGLATVMTILGVTLSFLGQSFGQQNSSLLYYGIGILCIAMALQMLEIIHLPLPQTIKTLPETKQGKLTTFYVLGCAFGVVASPCGTPVLAAILGIISKQGNIILGGASLFCYAVGQGLLLLVAGLSTGLLKHKSTFFKAGAVLSRVSGVIIFLAGLVFILQAAGLWTPLLNTLHIES